MTHNYHISFLSTNISAQTENNTNEFVYFQPIQVREHNPTKLHNIQQIGVFTQQSIDKSDIIKLATTLEEGRRTACDIGDADPERMAPPKVEEYIKKTFAGTEVTVSTVKDVEDLEKNYPLFEAVNRAASNIKRHQGRIIFLEYRPKVKHHVSKLKTVVNNLISREKSLKLSFWSAKVSLMTPAALMSRLAVSWLVCQGTNVGLQQ